MSFAEIAYEGAELIFAPQTAQPPVQGRENCALLQRALTNEPAVLSLKHQLQAIITRDHRLQREPPKLAGALRKTGWYINGEWDFMPLQNRIGVLQRVLIAVVESNSDKAAGEVAFNQAAVHLVQRNDIHSREAESDHHLLKKIRRYFKQPVGLKYVRARRPNVVECQDEPDATVPAAQH